MTTTKPRSAAQLSGIAPLQPETVKAMQKITPGTASWQSNELGVIKSEPLIIAMDGLLRYAKAYVRRFDGNLADDYALGPEWLAAAKGIRGLLNGDGAVAMERGINSDSKDNRVIEEMFWAALGIAGFKEADL